MGLLRVVLAAHVDVSCRWVGVWDSSLKCILHTLHARAVQLASGAGPGPAGVPA